MNSGWNGTPQNTTKMVGTHLPSGTGLAPDDSLLDLRDINVQEIFGPVWQAPQRVMKSEERGIQERFASGGARYFPPRFDPFWTPSSQLFSINGDMGHHS